MSGSRKSARCPACGEAALSLYVNLRRWYAPDNVSLHAAPGQSYALTYEGWGSQAGDEIEMASCESCGAEFTPREVEEANEEGRREP